MEYLGRNDLVQVPPVANDLPEPPKGIALDAGVQLDLTEAAMEDDIDAQKQAADFADSDDPVPVPAPAGGPGAQKVVVGGNGNGSGATATAAAAAPRVDTMDAALSDLMGDAPLCDTCGHITVRNGSCYRCLNCGNSIGCS